MIQKIHTKEGEYIGWYDRRQEIVMDTLMTKWEGVKTYDKARRILECSFQYEKDMAEILSKE